MFVECFSGLMGGGKSFFSVKRMAEHHAKGGVVFSNIKLALDPWFNEAYAHKLKSFWRPECYDGCRVELHVGGLILPVIRVNKKTGKNEFEYNSRGYRHYLKVGYGWDLQDGQYHYLKDEYVNSDLPEHLPRGSQTSPVLVILDEALDHFETGESSKNANAEFRSFLRHIRKLGINLIFIAQDFGSLDRKICALTHFVWKFRDMSTWPVPVFNRPLPSPWGDHIVCEKYHRTQFGKAKSEVINKNTWVFRDTNIFGSYQSISLHNSGIKMAEGLKIDFSDEGRIVKGIKKMNWVERIVLFSCLIVSIFGLMRSRPAEIVLSDALDSRIEPSNKSVVAQRPITVIYGHFRYYELDGDIQTITVDGIEYWIGQQTNAGAVIAIAKKQIHIMDLSGRSTFIYPDFGFRYEISEEEIAASPAEGKDSLKFPESQDT